MVGEIVCKVKQPDPPPCVSLHTFPPVMCPSTLPSLLPVHPSPHTPWHLPEPPLPSYPLAPIPDQPPAQSTWSLWCSPSHAAKVVVAETLAPKVLGENRGSGCISESDPKTRSGPESRTTAAACPQLVPKSKIRALLPHKVKKQGGGLIFDSSKYGLIALRCIFVYPLLPSRTISHRSSGSVSYSSMLFPQC